MKNKKSDGAAKELLEHAIDKICDISEGIEEPIYVLDPQSYTIIFANEKTKKLFGEKIVGKKCYRVFQGLGNPCLSCTNKHILGKNVGKSYTCEHQNKKNKRWYRGIYKAIRWPNGGHVKYGIAIDITEQKKTGEALKRSEELFRSIVENSHTCILIIDDNFRITYANDEAMHLSKYPMKEIIGQDFRKFLVKEDIASLEDRYLRRQRGENVPSQYEFAIISKDGEKLDVEIKAAILKDECNGTQTLVQLLDITNRKKMENERKLFEGSLSSLNKYAQSVNMTKKMTDIYKLTLEAMEKILGFEYASILTVEGKMLCLMANRGYSRNFALKLPLDEDRGITVRAVKTGKSVLIPDISKDKAYIEGGIGIRSELTVPIKVGDTVLGALNVESKKLSAFNENDRKLLEILASHAAVAISNLQTRNQFRKLSEKLEYLMKSSTQIMHVKKMHQRLEVIARAIQEFGWRRVVISLRDENLNGTDVVTAGLTEEETRLLMERKASGQVWKERLGPKFKRYKIGEFYYLPWSDPWIRKHVHGVPNGVSPEEATTYAGVPSTRSIEEMVDWHPQDMIYAPLHTPEGKIVGILSMDDPIDGRRPSPESLTPLELFLHQAAITIENSQLIDGLRSARKQLEEYADQLEQKVEQRTCELRESQEQLLKAQRFAVIGELAGMVGHDLRNPLTSIGGAEYYLRKRLIPKVDGKIKEMLELIEKNIAYSNKIINDLLDYSREVELDLTECSLKSLVKEALTLVNVPKNVKIVDLTESAPRIEIDCDKMKRVFVNMIKNASEAMPKGGTLTIKCKKLDTCLEIVFSDTGVGMSKKTYQALWSPLFTTKAKGMGFGLPICKRFIEAHGGTISVKSTFKKGTTFTITIPTQPKVKEGGEKIWVKQLESSLLTTTKT